MITPEKRSWERMENKLLCTWEKYLVTYPANTKHLYNICTMLDQRRRLGLIQ